MEDTFDSISILNKFLFIKFLFELRINSFLISIQVYFSDLFYFFVQRNLLSIYSEKMIRIQTIPNFCPSQNFPSEQVFHQLSFDQDAAHLAAWNLDRTALLRAQLLSEGGYSSGVDNFILTGPGILWSRTPFQSTSLNHLCFRMPSTPLLWYPSRLVGDLLQSDLMSDVPDSVTSRRRPVFEHWKTKGARSIPDTILS
jgi:hypothetical protein